MEHNYPFAAIVGQKKMKLALMYQSMAETFLFNEEIRRWMEEVNRWSVHSVSERLLEAHQCGMWDTDEETLRRLQGIYMQAEGTIEEVSK